MNIIKNFITQFSLNCGILFQCLLLFINLIFCSNVDFFLKKYPIFVCQYSTRLDYKYIHTV